MWKFPEGGAGVKYFFANQRSNEAASLTVSDVGSSAGGQLSAAGFGSWAENIDPGSPVIVRIAIYDVLTSTPRIEEVFGDTPLELIERLAARVYQVAHDAGGPVPYMVIRELTENLLHAGFADVAVSIMDDGHVVRFSDAGPGIRDVDRALRPGFTTATSSMRRFIRGVGSGLPIASECMGFAGGSVTIDSNLAGGTVVTATARRSGTARTGPAEDPLVRTATCDPVTTLAPAQLPVRPLPVPPSSARGLSDRQKQTLALIMEVGPAGPSRVSRELSVALATAHRDLAFLESGGLLVSDSSGKRTLTPLGISYVDGLF